MTVENSKVESVAYKQKDPRFILSPSKTKLNELTKFIVE